MYMEMVTVEDQTITGNEHSNPDLVTMHKLQDITSGKSTGRDSIQRCVKILE